MGWDQRGVEGNTALQAPTFSQDCQQGAVLSLGFAFKFKTSCKPDLSLYIRQANRSIFGLKPQWKPMYTTAGKPRSQKGVSEETELICAKVSRVKRHCT